MLLAPKPECAQSAPSGLLCQGLLIQYVYDQLDRLVRATDNAGQTTRFGYDSRDNLVFRSDPEGPLTADPLGLFPGQINGPGNTTTWFYDGVNRQVRQLTDLRVGGTGAGTLDLGNAYNPDGQISLSYEFDRNSNVTGIVDDKGNRTRFVYDELDRKVQQINADNEAWTYTYDRDDNVRTVTDPNGTVSTKTYDVLNRLTQVDVARALGVAGTTQETFGYDGLSRMTHSTDNNGAAADQTCDRAYDSLGRLVEERFNGTPVSSVFTGDGKRVSCTYPGGRVITQTFDVIDRVLSVSDAGGVIATSDWIGPGYRELRRVNGNGTTFTFLNDAATADIGYDAVKRITRMRHLLPNGTAFIDREYTYNRANVRTSATRNDDFGMTDSFTYDSAYRVISSAYDQGGSGGVMRDLTSQSYKLDGVGNRRVVDKVSTANGASSEAVAVNEVNEYVSVDGVARTHSDNGNLVDNGTLLFVFDYKNRLVAATDKATSQPVAQYLYYSDNRRAQKTVFATSSTTQFFYDGWQVCEETGASNATYVWNPVYVDELVRMDSGGQQFYAHQNARCDVVAVTDGAGNVVEKRFYDDYGRILDANKQPTVLGATPYGFQGRRFDPETGLYYFRNRYYDPETGRFVQRDPVWDAANVGGQYSFAGSGPLSGRDAYGLQGQFAKDLTGISDWETTYGALSADVQEGNWLWAAGLSAVLVIQTIDTATTVIPVVGQVKGAVKGGVKMGIKKAAACGGAKAALKSGAAGAKKVFGSVGADLMAIAKSFVGIFIKRLGHASVDQIKNLKRALGKAYEGAGMKFGGFNFTSGRNQFNPGDLSISLMGSSQHSKKRFTLIDEVGHALDWLEEGTRAEYLEFSEKIMDQYKVLNSCSKSDRAAVNAAREIQRLTIQLHINMFKRMQKRIASGTDEVMSTFTTPADADVLGSVIKGMETALSQ